MADRRSIVITLTALVAFACLTAAAQAAFAPRVSYGAYGKAAAVLINGRNAAKFGAYNGGLSPLQRAKITSDRLAALVASKFDPNALTVKGDRYSARIYAGTQLVCIATSHDAKLNNTTPLGLASVWAASIRRLLLMPPVVVEPDEITVPLGENRRVEVGGAATGPISVKIDNSDVANVVVEPAGRRLTISAKNLGKAIVEVSCQGEKATLVVYAKKYAGWLPPVSVGQVTGNPCPASLVCYCARQAVAQSAYLEPGSRLEVGAADCPNKTLGPGEKQQIKVDVKIVGPDYIPVATRATAEVRNVVIPRREPVQLFYSNNPESITRYQSLFVGKLDPDTPTRILYHHQNAMRSRVHLIVELVNPNDAPATIRVHRGISPPSTNTITVGHVAGWEFLKECASDISVIEVIPAQSRLVLVSDILAAKETSSGILQVNQLAGDPAYVRITAAEPGVDMVSRGTIARASDLRNHQLSDHIYPSPVKNLEYEYVVGQRWAFVPIGKHEIGDTNGQKKLYGNYGVTYNITVRISNPTGEARKIMVIFDPTAGPASGVFWIDGKPAAVKYAQPPKEVTLRTITLAPGESRTVRITTVPLAGSNYPATLIVRS